MVLVETRSPRPLPEMSPWVTVLSGEDLERRQINFLSDALRTVPGMAVVRSGQAGSLASLFSRGANSDHVTFLLDGRRLTGGFSGLYNLGQLSLTGLSGVEVLRGSSSTLYGAEGIGGAVMLRSGQAPAEGMVSDMGLVGGSFGSFRGDLRNAFRAGKWEGSLGLAASTTENDAPNADFENHAGSFRFAKALDEVWTFDFVGLGYRSEQGVPGPTGTGYPSLVDYQDTEQYLFSPGLVGSGEGWTVRGFYSGSADQVESLTSGWFMHNDFRVRSDQVEVQLEKELSEVWNLTLGGSYARQDFRKKNLGMGANEVDDGWENQALFGLLEYAPTEKTKILLGGRMEEYSDFGNPSTWQLSGRRMLGDSASLFVRYATSFSPPQASDLYGVLGNRNLKAEEADTWEMGVRLGADDGSTGLQVTYFGTNFTNLIQWEGASTDNVGLAKSHGVESILELKLSTQWKGKASYVYLEAMNENEGIRLPRRPRHSGSLGLDYFGESCSCGAEFQFVVDRRDIDGGTWAGIDGEDYCVARTYVSYGLAQDLSLFGRVENLFDEEYEEVDGYPALGIGVFGGLRYSF